jgi:pilus assembly protein CpaD
MNGNRKIGAKRRTIARAASLLGVLALVSACESMDRADRWVEKQWIVESRHYSPERVQIGVHQASVADTVAFAPRSGQLTPAQHDQLARFVAGTGAKPGDAAIIALSPAGGPGLASQRVAAIAAVLHSRGLRVLRSIGAEPLPHVATVTITREVASGPDCPEWDRLMKRNEVDEHKLRFGCFNAASLAASVNRPRDLVQPRPSGPSDAQTLDRGLQQLREGKFDAKPDPEGAGTRSSGTAK